MNLKEINEYIKSVRNAQNDLDAVVSASRDKLITNLEYERAGDTPPYDYTLIHAELNALRDELKSARNAVPDEVVNFPPALLSVFPEYSHDTAYTEGERIRGGDGKLYRALTDVAAGIADPSECPELWEDIKQTIEGAAE
ncbi:MAG: hypothetical protein ACI4I3_06075 [Acutalibacteraceae bacterium]